MVDSAIKPTYKKASKPKPKLQTVLEAKVTGFANWTMDDENSFKISQIRHMLRLDETTALGYESLCQIIVGMIGDYTQDSPEITDYINKNLAKLKGTNDQKWLDACAMMPYGFAFAQLKHDILPNGKAELSRINFLEQEYTVFEGTSLGIEKVKFYGDKVYELDPNLCFHVINQSNVKSNFDPYGCRLGDRALRYWELDKILLASYAVVAQKQATKLLVGQTETDAEVQVGWDSNGSPLLANAGDVMLAALQQTENSSAVVVGINDKITAVDQNSDGDFFLRGFNFTEAKRFRAFLHSQTMFGTSPNGVGDAGLAESQQQNVMNVCASKAKYLAVEFVEQILKPLIIFNFGEQENYGSFTLNSQNPNSLEIAKVLSDAIQSSTVFTNEDDFTMAVNRLKDILGVE